jgi:hypothetical protein
MSNTVIHANALQYYVVRTLRLLFFVPFKIAVIELHFLIENRGHSPGPSVNLCQTRSLFG